MLCFLWSIIGEEVPLGGSHRGTLTVRWPSFRYCDCHYSTESLTPANRSGAFLQDTHHGITHCQTYSTLTATTYAINLNFVSLIFCKFASPWFPKFFAPLSLTFASSCIQNILILAMHVEACCMAC